MFYLGPSGELLAEPIGGPLDESVGLAQWLGKGIRRLIDKMQIKFNSRQQSILRILFQLMKERKK